MSQVSYWTSVTLKCPSSLTCYRQLGWDSCSFSELEFHCIPSIRACNVKIFFLLFSQVCLTLDVKYVFVVYVFEVCAFEESCYLLVKLITIIYYLLGGYQVINNTHQNTKNSFAFMEFWMMCCETIQPVQRGNMNGKIGNCKVSIPPRLSSIWWVEDICELEVRGDNDLIWYCVLHISVSTCHGIFSKACLKPTELLPSECQQSHYCTSTGLYRAFCQCLSRLLTR